MSEQAPNLTPPAGPSPEQIDVDAAFDPVARQAQEQMDIYAQNRPYQDANGAVHDPANGNFVTPDKYFDEQHQIAEDGSQSPYEDMSIPALAHKLGEAEHYDDRTTQDSVTEVLLEKMGTEEARIAGEGGSETEARQDNLWDSVMAAKDLKKRQLEKKNGQPEPGEGDADDPAVDGAGPEESQDENNNEGAGADNPGGMEVPDHVKPFARPAYMEYGRHTDENGEDKGPKIAETYDAVGDLMDWSKNPEAQRPDREIILNAEDGNGGQVKWFVKGNKIYEIDLSRPNKTSTATPEPTIRVHELQPGEDLPPMLIGQDIKGGLRLKDVLIATGEDYHQPTNSGSRPKPPVTPYVRYQPNRQGQMQRKINTDPALINPRHGRLTSDPFAHLEELTGGDAHGEPEDPFNPAGSPNGPENGSPNGPEAQQVNLEDAISHFSARFEDKTYVPTLEEYQQMLEVAGRIRIDYGDEEGKRPIRYLNADGGQLNATATRGFLDKVTPKNWEMKHRETDVAEDLQQHATPINVRRLDLEQRTRRDWLSFRQFADARAPEQNPPDGLPSEELVDQYKEYIQRRVDISNALTGRQAAYDMYGDQASDVIAAEVEAGRDVVTAEDVTMSALASFRRGIGNERQRRRRNAIERLRNARPDRVARRAAQRVRGRS